MSHGGVPAGPQTADAGAAPSSSAGPAIACHRGQGDKALGASLFRGLGLHHGPRPRAGRSSDTCGNIRSPCCRLALSLVSRPEWPRPPRRAALAGRIRCVSPAGQGAGRRAGQRRSVSQPRSFPAAAPWRGAFSPAPPWCSARRGGQAGRPCGCGPCCPPPVPGSPRARGRSPRVPDDLPRAPWGGFPPGSPRRRGKPEPQGWKPPGCCSCPGGPADTWVTAHGCARSEKAGTSAGAGSSQVWRPCQHPGGPSSSRPVPRRGHRQSRRRARRAPKAAAGTPPFLKSRDADVPGATASPSCWGDATGGHALPRGQEEPCYCLGQKRRNGNSKGHCGLESQR